MANSKFQYVRSFETEDRLEPLQWIILQLKYLERKNLIPDNDYTCDFHLKFQTALTNAAKYVMNHNQDLSICYGHGDTYNFIFNKYSSLYKRRGFKLLTYITSLFSAAYVANWNLFFNNYTLNSSILPIFEGSIYLLPKDQCLRDFLTGEQYKCHINNLDLTTKRKLIEIGKFSYKDAIQKVSSASVSEKNELLFSLCNINYNNEDVIAKKGSILLNNIINSKYESNNKFIKKDKILTDESNSITEINEDFCKDSFWIDQYHLEEQTKHNLKKDMNLFKKTNFIIPHTWMVIRIDGKKFHNFSEIHNFSKPNDIRSLRLFTRSAKVVMKKFPTIIVSYGQSDEYSFVFRRYNHREKDGYSLSSRIVSLFTSAFVHLWNTEFEENKLHFYPSFDARLVLYPTNSSLRDYLSWRQADCHINNMYNTCFWKLIEQKNISNCESEQYLRGTLSANKLEILEKELGIIYDLEEAIYRKGTILYSKLEEKNEKDFEIFEEYIDLIRNEFWEQRPWLLGNEL